VQPASSHSKTAAHTALPPPPIHPHLGPPTSPIESASEPSVLQTHLPPPATLEPSSASRCQSYLMRLVPSARSSSVLVAVAFPGVIAPRRHRRIAISCTTRRKPQRHFSATPHAASNAQAILAEAFSATVRAAGQPPASPESRGAKAHHVAGGRGGFVNPWNRCA